jgi:pyruvate dehydrogenase E1 component
MRDDRRVLLEREATSGRLRALEAVQARVLWLATSLIHHANRVRPNRSGLKVGGHQASSASAASIMTALYFDHLRGGDLVSVKPHASPVLHAVEYLLGLLEPEDMTTLREFGGLQAYPSRTKDPVPADFSTGSVGIGATAPIWRALAHRYVAGHFEVPVGGRAVSVVGDAELDEGAVWEALVDPIVPRLGEVLWVVDLNRQSLDRVVPNIAAGRIATMFEAAGWQTITLKYGRRLEEVFARDGGEALRRRIDEMPNEEYQRLLGATPETLREALSRGAERVVRDLDDTELALAIRDLGGHDLGGLLDAFAAADAQKDRPSVVFAYTIKAWRLPTEGHPTNHSALLTEAQWEQLAGELGTDPADPWARFAEGSDEARLCAEAAERLRREPLPEPRPVQVPPALDVRYGAQESTQQAFGRILVELDRQAPEVAARVVTVSPDVASSTNLGGWINRAGVWYPGDRIDWFADDEAMLIKWRETEHGRHVELGIAEVNLVGLLGELGATWSRDGEPLLPIGTIYDPFLSRALEPWSFGIYAGGQSILVGTPSGVTLSPEGGAHQSVTTPSIALEQPGCVSWEPAFAQDLEWALLHALSRLGRPGGESAYFRLSTRAVDQSLAGTGDRRLALAGGYRLVTADGRPDVAIVAVGAVVPEALAAADVLAGAGIAADVVCLTSPSLVFRALQARQGLRRGEWWILDELFPRERAVPLVTVLDGHPHTLSFCSAVRGQPAVCLGVQDFGQSGDVEDLYRHFGIDVETIVGAACDAVDGID